MFPGSSDMHTGTVVLQTKSTVCRIPSIPPERNMSADQRKVVDAAQGGQAPFALAHFIIRSMATTPNSTVVVFGSGTGTEVLAAIRNGHPVMAFENSRALVSPQPR